MTGDKENMAIYTNYGRYLKAKMFKQMLSDICETYMLFGTGDCSWDKSEEIPIAPYNTSIISDSSVDNNQFFDSHVNQYFIECSNDGSVIDQSTIGTIQTINDGAVEIDSGLMNAAKDHLPPFPCIWQHYNYDDPEDNVLISVEDGAPGDQFVVTKDNYHEFLITSSDNVSYTWYRSGESTIGTSLAITTRSSKAAQCFSELVLRGKSALHHLNYIKTDAAQPCVAVGLLGAVKCSIDFVKDIGIEGDTTYSGKVNQFFYGDRYWEIVSPNEILDKDKDLLPTHLIITATVNPRNLYEILKIDQNITPRQIAIYFREKRKDSENKSIDGKTFYRVSENLFNFGQYRIGENGVLKDEDTIDDPHGEILNFNPAYSYIDETTQETIQCDSGEFKFILTDYIKGSIRADGHAVERFGYVIGF